MDRKIFTRHHAKKRTPDNSIKPQARHQVI